MKSCFVTTFLFIAMVTMAGCSSAPGYHKAFSSTTVVEGNSEIFKASAVQAMKAVKQTLVRQGFTIESGDIANGIIKAVRNMHDPEISDVSYNIHVSADVTSMYEQVSEITLSASQQTIHHHESYTWWHLLWLIPLFPIGSEYQTIIADEGNVTDPGFYKDFFNSLAKTIPVYEIPAKITTKTTITTEPNVPDPAATSTPVIVTPPLPETPSAIR